MKMLTEYLERALEFEGLANREDTEAFKAGLQKQAAAYRNWQRSVPSNMASQAELAKRIGFPRHDCADSAEGANVSDCNSKSDSLT